VNKNKDATPLNTTGK